MYRRLHTHTPASRAASRRKVSVRATRNISEMATSKGGRAMKQHGIAQGGRTVAAQATQDCTRCDRAATDNLRTERTCAVQASRGCTRCDRVSGGGFPRGGFCLAPGCSRILCEGSAGKDSFDKPWHGPPRRGHDGAVGRCRRPVPMLQRTMRRCEERKRGASRWGRRHGWERRWAKLARLGVKSRTWWGSATAVHVVKLEGETHGKIYALGRLSQLGETKRQRKRRG